MSHGLHASRREKGVPLAQIDFFSRSLEMFEVLFQSSTSRHILPFRPLIFLLTPILTSRNCNTKALSRPSEGWL